MAIVTEITVKDCSPFPNQDQPEIIEVINELIKGECKNYVLNFAESGKIPDDSKIAEFNYKDGKWYAGRYVGQISVATSKGVYRVNIIPRFGNVFLFRILEEIFNVRFHQSFSELSTSNSSNHLIKKIIAFIWLQKLGNANKHGVPKKTETVLNTGYTIKGKINVRKTIYSYFKTGEIISQYSKKVVDPVIAQILSQAYRILNRDFGLTNLRGSESAIDAIHEFESSAKDFRYLNTSQFDKIRYKDIYLPFKPVVDLSWELIKSKKLNSQQKDSKHEKQSFLIDIAELWEIYLRSLLKTHLGKSGWKVYSKSLDSYSSMFYKRKIIPDIIAEKGDDYIIWDAKYKRMNGSSLDIDRADFFQIHTYLQYFSGERNVLGGGLLYPTNFNKNVQEKYSNNLLNEFGQSSIFGIDGIDLQFLEDWNGSQKDAFNEIKLQEANFINQINEVFNLELEQA